MTVPSTVSEIGYAGNGVTVTFTVPFVFSSASDLTVTSTDSSGNITTLTSGYSVSGGNGSTGSVTFNTAPAVGVSINIFDDPDFSQDTDYVNNDEFPADAHERALDKNTRMSKALKQLIQRCLRAPLGDPSTQLELASVDTRKGKYLFFNAVTGAIEYAASVIGTTLSQSVIGQFLHPKTGAETAAGATIADYSVPNHLQCGYISPLRYGVNTTPGTTDMTAAMNTAVAVAKQLTAGAYILLPQGDIKILSTWAIDQAAGGIHVRGQGRRATRIVFAPTADDTCIELGKTGLADRTSHGSLKDLSLWSADGTYTKIGIDCIDISNWNIENIEVYGDVVVPGIGRFWSGGTGSIGVRTRGRELCKIGPLFVYADKQVVVAKNPTSSIDLDHFTFKDLTLTSSSNLAANGDYANFEVLTGVNWTNSKLIGSNAFVRGTDGFRWIDTTSSGASNNCRLSGIRWEQGGNVNTKYCIRIEHNYELQHLVVDDCYGGLDRSGLYLRKCSDVKVRDSFYIGSTGFVAMDVDATVKRMVLDEFRTQSGATANLVGQSTVIASPKSPSGAPLPYFAVYDEAANADDGLVTDKALSGAVITVADNGTYDLGGTSMAGFLTIVSGNAEIARFQMNGTNHTTTELTDIANVFSISQGTVSSINVYWNAGSSTYRLENKRGGSRNFKLVFDGSFSSF